MKLGSKPISSPSRLDKFPPPLMRFLRNNGGSRSRGRSRSSPIFIRRRNEASTEGPEPSSPKVTCMGQVRVRRSKQVLSSNDNNTKRAKTGQRRPCLWLRKALFCNLCGFRKAKARLARPCWERWFVPFKFGCGRKVEEMEKSSEKESKREDQTEEYADTDEDEVREKKVFVPCSPPKNALLLMRCKSEPCRASSLAYRFWGSPSSLEVEHTQQIQTDPNHHKEEEEEEEEEEEVPMSRNEPNCRDSTAESRTDPENEEILDYRERLESSINQTRSFKLGDIGERKNRRAEVGEESARRELARPLILPRCKSEPARLPEKLDSESWFWKRRLNHFEMPPTTRF